MGVKKKGRRKISVGDTEYIWYVEIDSESIVWNGNSIPV